MLNDLDEDLKVYFSNEGGYTYGSINEEDVRTTLVVDRISYIQEESLPLRRTDFNRISQLLDIYFEDSENYQYMSKEKQQKMEKKINEIDARQEDNPYSFTWSFKNQKELWIDIRSTTEEYRMEVRIYDKVTQKTEDLDWGYCSQDFGEYMEFEYDDDTYNISFELVD